MKQMNLGAKGNAATPTVVLADMVEDMADLKVFLIIKDCPELAVGLEFQESEVTMYSGLLGVPEKTYVESPKTAGVSGSYTPVDCVRELLKNADIGIGEHEFVTSHTSIAKGLEQWEPAVMGTGAKTYRSMAGLSKAIEELYVTAGITWQ